MLCTQQELLHSTLQLSLQRISSLRKCQQPTGAVRQAPPASQHPGTRVTGGTKKLLGHSLDPPPQGRDPRMTHGRQCALSVAIQWTLAYIHTYKTQISQNNTYRYYVQHIGIFDSFFKMLVAVVYVHFTT